MLNTADLSLGSFLILCGFALSLFNLRRVLKGGVTFSSVLLSENIILIAIGIAYVSRSVYSLNPTNFEDNIAMEERAAEFPRITTKDGINCGFKTLLLSYGPLIVSMVNSFLSLIIDNYMHYKILENLKGKIDENVVREMSEAESERKFDYNICNFWNKHLSFVTIAMQWIVPILTALAMYPVTVKEISMSQARNMDGACMAMLDLTYDECTTTNATNYATDLPKYIQSPINFFEILDNDVKTNNTNIDKVLSNVLTIINNFNNETNLTFATLKSSRRPKTDENCMKMCYTDNKSLLSYMFIIGFVSYFIPITISTTILTRIHTMEITKMKMKGYAMRELLCNILFWTPVMFDTVLSLILCSYSMQGMRSSIFNVIANVYQALKNFMSTKYIKENIIVPI